MQSISKHLAWFDEHLLLIIASFLFVFIPLYPKLPLFDILPGYIVRVRLEDFFVATALLLWLVQVIRKKAQFHSLLLMPITIYLAVGFLSMLSAIFIIKTVPMEVNHVGKMALHWLRRVEYFSLYFVVYSAIKKVQHVKLFTILFGLTVITASIYGLGQKLYQWPVYSTMNREFAKGWKLVLTEHARVPSTFAGHYDFAAYLVLFLTISASVFLFDKREPVKVVSLIGFTAALISLILTSSRASYLSYLAAVTLAVSLLAFKKKDWLWGLKRWAIVIFVSITFMVGFGDLSQRFADAIDVGRITGYIKHDVLKLPEQDKYLQLTDDLALVTSPSDQPFVPESRIDRRTGKELPPDVTNDLPAWYESTESATMPGQMVAKAKPRTYSDNAFTFGLSQAIRFDALWPRAIKGFLSNPLLGSGYSTLTKERVELFTEAESTDNDILRALGETGALGFLAFYGIIGYALWHAWGKREELNQSFIYAVVAGIAASSIGLIINALYIDVFEASKVAFTFWTLMGLFVASVDKLGSKRPA